MVQSTFTKQKRELAKAAEWIDKIRAVEVRNVSYDATGTKTTETKESYVDYAPEEIARHVLAITTTVVKEHGSRQRANSKNTGTFSWRTIKAQLTVPQLRALKEAHATLTTLVSKLPRRNPKVVHNGELHGRPAYLSKPVEQFVEKVRYKPYEEVNSTRVRTYEEHYRELIGSTQRVEVDYGLDIRLIETLHEMVTDLGTAIQVAIDEANAKGHEEDPVLSKLIEDLCKEFDQVMPNQPTSHK